MKCTRHVLMREEQGSRASTVCSSVLMLVKTLFSERIWIHHSVLDYDSDISDLTKTSTEAEGI